MEDEEDGRSRLVRIKEGKSVFAIAMAFTSIYLLLGWFFMAMSVFLYQVKKQLKWLGLIFILFLMALCFVTGLGAEMIAAAFMCSIFCAPYMIIKALERMLGGPINDAHK